MKSMEILFSAQFFDQVILLSVCVTTDINMLQGYYSPTHFYFDRLDIK